MVGIDEGRGKVTVKILFVLLEHGNVDKISGNVEYFSLTPYTIKWLIERDCSINSELLFF